MSGVKTGSRCPKCGGNLYLDSDHNGWYEQCLQCAYMKDLAVVYQKGAKMERGLKEAVFQKPDGTGKKDAVSGE